MCLSYNHDCLNMYAYIISEPGCPATFVYSRARACCACSRCGTGGLYIYFFFHLFSISNVLSFGRRLKMTGILLFRLLNPNGSCQLLPRTSSLSTVNCLEGLGLPRNSTTIKDQMTKF